MENIALTDFKKCWEKFSSQLQGQLITKAKSNTLQTASANLALSDSVSFWDDRYAEGRKWLDGLSVKNAEKAKLIEEILLDDMQFQTLAEQKSNDKLLKYGIPMGGAVMGFVVSKAIGTALPGRAVLMGGMALAGCPLGKGMASASRDGAKKKMIDEYMQQLEKYRLSVERILTS